MRAERVKERLSEASAVRVPARAPRWVVPVVKATLVLADACLTLLSFFAAFKLREGGPILQNAGGAAAATWPVWSEEFAPYGAILLLVLPIRLLALKYYDLYRVRGEFSLVEDGVRIFKATAIGSLLIVAAAFLYRGVYEYRAFSYARGVFILDFLLALSSLGLLRLILRGAQTLARRRDINLIPTLVVGRGPEAALFINEMRERPALGYRVIGVVENGVIDQTVPEMFEGVKVISDLKGLPEAIRESGANEVIITDPTLPGDALFEVMMRSRAQARRRVQDCAEPLQLPAAQDGDRPDRRAADDHAVSRAALFSRAHHKAPLRSTDRGNGAHHPLAALARDRAAHQARLERPSLLQAGASRDGWPPLPLL